VKKVMELSLDVNNGLWAYSPQNLKAMGWRRLNWRYLWKCLCLARRQRHREASPALHLHSRIRYRGLSWTGFDSGLSRSHHLETALRLEEDAAGNDADGQIY
jgi:hypothetical protein